MELRGDIDAALAWGKTQIGKPYDHEAGAGRFGPNEFDCSGLICASLWASGMPRYWMGMGENSAQMAQWAEDHPDRNIGPVAARNTRGALLVKGGIGGYGDAGHVVFSLGDGRTLESNGRRGVCIDDADRLSWWHGLLPPVNFAHLTPEEGFMSALSEAEQRELLTIARNLDRFKNEITHPNDELPWGGALLKLANVHKIVSDLRDGFTGSAKDILDAGATGAKRGYAKLRQNVFDILEIAQKA